MADETKVIDTPIDEEITDVPLIEEKVDYSSQQIEVVIPQRKIIDETEGIEIGKFEKIIEEESVGEDGSLITTRKIVPMTNDEAIEKRIAELKFKVAIGTATTTEKADLKLLTS